MSLDDKTQRFIISGGPGTGKSTLLAALAGSGEVCREEVSRQVIREQKAQGGRLLPWFDLTAFAQECVARMQMQLAESPLHQRVFFDRGLPDVVGYMRHGGLIPPAELRTASRAYSPWVFFAPPWREIFANDTERPQTYEVSVALSKQIRLAYSEFGFRVIELERTSVEGRVQQILEQVELFPKEDCTWVA
jgi:predicted ATPase